VDGPGVWIMPIFILTVALGLVAWHIRQWGRLRQQDLPAEDADFYRRQFRRRLQCSTMLALLAVGLLVVPWIPSPVGKLLLGLAMLLLAIWLGLLALADLFLTQHHYQRLHSDCVVEQAKLQMEARRLRSLAGRNRPSKPDSPPPE